MLNLDRLIFFNLKTTNSIKQLSQYRYGRKLNNPRSGSANVFHNLWILGCSNEGTRTGRGARS